MSTTYQERFRLHTLLAGQAYNLLRVRVISDLMNDFAHTAEEIARKESRNEEGGYNRDESPRRGRRRNPT